MKRLLLLTAVVVLGSLAAQAGTTVLTFEVLQNSEQLLNYYNGGLGGNGSGNFDGAPTMPTARYFLSGAGDIMKMSAGFTTGFSFFYGSPFYTASATARIYQAGA